MKQYTTPEQTAKLIELGFEKPKNTQYVQRAKARNLHSPFIEFGEPEFEGSYTISELIEMLGVHLSSIYYIGIVWVVNAEGLERRSEELIDALYDMCIKLQKEEVI